MNFIKKGNAEGYKSSLKYHLHKHMAGWRPARSISRVHASDLMNPKGEFCPRQYALMDILKTTPKDQFIGTSLNVTFAIGGFVEDVVVGSFADMGMAVGDWRCSTCNTLHEFGKRPKACKTTGCNSNQFKYQEIRVKSEKSGISCGIDLLLDTGKIKLEIIELKSMKGEDHKALKAPLAEHKFRTNIYMRCAEESNHPKKDLINTKQATILYVSKGFGSKDEEVAKYDFMDAGFSPYKEFKIVRDDELTQSKVDLATSLKIFRETGGAIPDKICNTSFCPRAKFCPVLVECFSGKYH